MIASPPNDTHPKIEAMLIEGYRKMSASQKLERVLTTDPAMGVLRHVDAGYERAIDVARERGVHIPMLD